MDAGIYRLADMPADKIEAALKDSGLEIVAIRQVAFVDGTTQPQWTAVIDGRKWHLTPVVSRAGVERHALAGRWVPAYSWIAG